MNGTEQCLAYVVQLRAEHHRIHDVVRRIERDWPQQMPQYSGARQIGNLLSELNELRRDLAEHFTAEEEGGCLEEAICRCPSIGHEADRIESEHPLLLQQLDAIIDNIRLAHQALKDVHRQFSAFAEQLQAHEISEATLLSTAFGMPVE